MSIYVSLHLLLMNFLYDAACLKRAYLNFLFIYYNSRFFHTARIENVILAAFEDEYGDNSKRRRLQAERIAVNLPKWAASDFLLYFQIENVLLRSIVF